MTIKGLEPFKREFVCKAITVGYFRVPQFRSIFIAQIKKKEYDEEEEKQSTASNIDIDQLVEKCQTNINSVNTIKNFFDWTQFCYSYIEASEQENNYKILQDQLREGADHIWSLKISQRGQVFFMVA